MTDARTIEECAVARSALEALPGVVAVSAVERDPRTGRNTLEITVGPDYQHVPARVLRTLADHDFGIRDVTSRGDPRHYVIVAD
jgi:hypothetical protein